jgi:hypothetical protein
MELRIRRIVRWNARVMVLRANHSSRHRRPSLDLRVERILYEVGFNHFFRGKDEASAIRSSSRDTRHRVSTRARSSKAADPRASSTTSAAKLCAARTLLRIRIPR